VRRLGFSVVAVLRAAADTGAEAVTRTDIKAALVHALGLIPSYRVQRILAAIVRRIWPGFTHA
jgi:hypothetical protein